MFGFLAKKEEKNKNMEIMVIHHFDEDAYLDANPTIESISTDTKTYLDKYGWHSIAAGKHKFHKDFDYFDEDRYLTLFDDVREGIIKGEFASGYEHFRLFGYDEIIQGLRKYNTTVHTSEPEVIEGDNLKNEDAGASGNDIAEELKSSIEEVDAQESDSGIIEKSEESRTVDESWSFDADKDDVLENEVPLPLIEGFNLQDYLNMTIEDSSSTQAYIFFDQVAYANIISGKSKFHKDFEPFEEERYYELCSDIREAVENGVLLSGIDHFVRYGYREIVEGKRYWPKEDKNSNLEKLRFINFRRTNLKSKVGNEQ